jgi:predicted DNA-binding mobile mystery protein A
MSRSAARKALDRKLSILRRYRPQLTPPSGGWIIALRQAMGMTASQLAARLGVGQPRVVAIEQAEGKGSLKLDTLRRVAEAMNCTLVYALVPNDALEHTMRARAIRVAEERMRRVKHTMALENQSTSTGSTQMDVKRMADEILEKEPSAIWAER